MYMCVYLSYEDKTFKASTVLRETSGPDDTVFNDSFNYCISQRWLCHLVSSETATFCIGHSLGSKINLLEPIEIIKMEWRKNHICN